MIHKPLLLSLTDANAVVKVKALSVQPQPIDLKQGSKITLSGSAEITGDAGVNYKVDVIIKRKLAGWFPVWVKVPCIKEFGSCTYAGLNCAKIWNEIGKPGKCPVPSGIHNLPTTVVTVPKVNIPSFLTS
ncbi:hypothetical protein QZH41_017571, partial [Actinostola sp. cb2023]